MDTNYQSCNPELWCRLEVIINRIRDMFHDLIRDGGDRERQDSKVQIAQPVISRLPRKVLPVAPELTGSGEIINSGLIRPKFEKIRSLSTLLFEHQGDFVNAGHCVPGKILTGKRIRLRSLWRFMHLFHTSGDTAKAAAKSAESLGSNHSRRHSWHHPVGVGKGWQNKSCEPKKSFPSLRIFRPFLVCFKRTFGTASIISRHKKPILHGALSGRKIVSDAGLTAGSYREACQKRWFRLNRGSIAIGSVQDIHLMDSSFDPVFNRVKETSHIEPGLIKFLTFYQQRDGKAEFRILRNFSSFLMAGTSAFFGPCGRYNLACQQFSLLKKKQKRNLSADAIVSLAGIPHLAGSALVLSINGEKDLSALRKEGRLNWYNFPEEVALKGGYKKEPYYILEVA